MNKRRIRALESSGPDMKFFRSTIRRVATAIECPERHDDTGPSVPVPGGAGQRAPQGRSPVPEGTQEMMDSPRLLTFAGWTWV